MGQARALGRDLQNFERAREAVTALPDGGMVTVTVLRGGVQVVLSAPLRR